MKKKHVIRAWRDPEYYASLSEADRARLPDHPAGVVELSDQDLNGLAADVAGGTTGYPTILCPTVIVTYEPGSQFCSIRTCDEP